MPKARWATLLMLAILAFLVALVVLVPRRPASSSRRAGSPGAEPPASSPSQPAGPLPVEPSGRPEERETPTISALPRGERPERGPPPQREARIAVVIDDVGYSLDGLKAFLAIPFPIAFAVLPNLPYSEEAARLITAAGKELLVHMPMEPMNGEDPGPGAILTSQDDRQIERALEQGFAGLPAAAGMNNHMGSKATADGRVMDIVMRYLAARRLYFLDSRTTADTQAEALAGRYGVPVLSRDVFMDNQADAAYILKAVRRGVELARRRGQAVLIGHVQDNELAGELARLLPELEGEGVPLVAPSSLARRQVRP
jgi:polysaccharide deacetylase 2 family uncharacterized protein YibQ